MLIFAAMKIGNIDLGYRPVMLAPMEDVTDIGFRLLCRRLGAAMVYSEFVSADAIVRLIKKSMSKLEVCDEERPVAIQIYGREPEPMAEAARIVVEQAHPDVLDINFGCPVKKIATKGAGSGLLKDPPKLLAITRAVVDAVGDKVPVTVKTRLGWDKEHMIIVDLAEQLQDCGISALTIHGRTRSQMYSDQADWTLIGEVKRNPRMHIPIIGNGDITSAEGALEAFERYGVDGIMLGRATFGRPWIFKEIDSYFRGIPYTPPAMEEKMEMMLRHVRMILEYSDKPPALAIKEARKATSWYMTGCLNASNFRARCYQLTSYAQAEALAKDVIHANQTP